MLYVDSITKNTHRSIKPLEYARKLLIIMGKNDLLYQVLKPMVEYKNKIKGEYRYGPRGIFR